MSTLDEITKEKQLLGEALARVACSGDFLLRLAGCQGKNLIVEARRAAAAAS